MKVISEESVKLIREHLPELGLTFPLNDEDGGYKIFKFFESLDAEIGDLRLSDNENDKKLIEDVGHLLSEFINPDDPIDYRDLERRLNLD